MVLCYEVLEGEKLSNLHWKNKCVIIEINLTKLKAYSYQLYFDEIRFKILLIDPQSCINCIYARATSQRASVKKFCKRKIAISDAAMKL